MVEGRAVHCKTFSSILGFSPVDDSSTHPCSCDNQKCLQILPNGPWGQNSSQLRTTVLEICSFGSPRGNNGERSVPQPH